MTAINLDALRERHPMPWKAVPWSKGSVTYSWATKDANNRILATFSKPDLAALLADALARREEADRLRAILKRCLTALLIETIGSTERRSPTGEIEPLLAAIRAALSPAPLGNGDKT